MGGSNWCCRNVCNEFCRQFGNRASQPTVRPETRHACKPFCRGSQVLVTWGAVGQRFGAKIPEDLVSTFQARPSHAPGTAPDDTSISILLRMPLLGPWSKGACSGNFAIHLRTIPACQ
eukprot:1157951-Pelagomonas_calceolata.AAC.4